MDPQTFCKLIREIATNIVLLADAHGTLLQVTINVQDWLEEWQIVYNYILDDRKRIENAEDKIYGRKMILQGIIKVISADIDLTEIYMEINEKMEELQELTIEKDDVQMTMKMHD